MEDGELRFLGVVTAVVGSLLSEIPICLIGILVKRREEDRKDIRKIYETEIAQKNRAWEEVFFCPGETHNICARIFIFGWSVYTKHGIEAHTQNWFLFLILCLFH